MSDEVDASTASNIETAGDDVSQENNAQVEADGGNIIENDDLHNNVNEESVKESSSQHHESDSIEDAGTNDNDNEKDAVDGAEAAEEPMEVDEQEVEEQETSQSADNVDNETKEAEHEQQESQEDENEEAQENDASNEPEKEKHADETSEMEVDCETPQGEDVPDVAQNNKGDESVMENNVEQLNCSDLSDPTQANNQTASDDPFDSLFKDVDDSRAKPADANVTEASEASRIDENDIMTDDENDADDGNDGDDANDVNETNDVNDANDANETNDNENGNDDDIGDTNSNHEAVDDIEEGKDADEEVCLLPDEEREISDADKARAMANQEADENEENEAADNEGENETNELPDGEADSENIDENGEKEASENQIDEQDAAVVEQTPADEATVPYTLNPNEIKEIDQEELTESLCLECGETVTCKYTLLKEIAPSEEDSDAPPKSEICFLCDIACMTKFKLANEQYKVIVRKVTISFAVGPEQLCRSCGDTKTCQYRFKEISAADSFEFICDEDCLNKFTEINPDVYVVAKKRFIIEETVGDAATAENKCMQCSDETKCKYTFKQDNDSFYLCTGPCLNLLLAEQPDRFRIKRQSIRVKDLPLTRAATNVEPTIKPRESKRQAAASEKTSSKVIARSEEDARLATLDREQSFNRRCAQCYTDIFVDSRFLQWETMDFCNESCLGQYQTVVGAACQSCQSAVSLASMGKYCVRFGFELRQFCRSACLDTFKKGLKVCSYCQKDVSKNEEFLAPINGQFKDFCSRKCMKCYEQIFNSKKPPVKMCAVCNNSKPVRVEVIIDRDVVNFCSNPCFSAFKFVNNINPDSCGMCRKYFERKSTNAHTIYQDSAPKVFCSKICMNIYIIVNRKIAPCQWCKVRKYNFDMIQKMNGPQGSTMLCSLNCLTMCEVSMNAIAMKQQKCDQCDSLTTPQYHLTMSDASMRNFCTYQCVMSFQSQFSRAPLTLEGESTATQQTQPVPAGLPKRIKAQQLAQQQQQQAKKSAPNRASNQYQSSAGKQPSKPSNNNLVISSVTSLAPNTRNTRRANQTGSPKILNTDLNRLQPVVALEPLSESLLEKSTRPVGRPRNTPIDTSTTSHQSQSDSRVESRVERQTQIITVPPLPKLVANMSTMCAPSTHEKEVQARPLQFTVGCQTDSYLERKVVIPIPVPIYVPQPLAAYAQPYPVPVPIPLPIPVPVFIPTTRNSANGIMKEIKKIQDKMPADPFEAELLMMAEMVAGDKKKEEETDSSSDEETPYQAEENHGFGEDMLQMALKMATEYDDPNAVDLEASMQANTITPHSHPGMNNDDVMHHHQQMMMMEQQRQIQTRKRAPAQRGRPPAKRGRRSAAESQPPPPEPQPVEKADANMCLKFTFGVNAWKQWVMTKNAELEKSSLRRKLFKTELLQLTADELNYSLCLFVKEVRKPNGSEYAPDTIYYLVLGIQEYLYENGRIDNIFTDPYYERFTDCLDEVAKKFSVLYNDSQYIVTRVEEEHLWECKQLGAHSPHVLLSTLMFFNTKHFNLTSVEEHMQLSFSHIMKHWKRNPNQGSAKIPGSRNVLLRFYPPQSAVDSSSRKKKVYEQQENEENPLRCPVKLYEFYLSKCPESVKTRNDVFYLMPERSCVPDSPVWYSTQALGKEALSKMLHRVKMVKEINIALLTS